jgi:DNA-nicking Smr family endonuclease
MNFGDILNKWEENNGIYDKDKEAGNERINPQEKRRRLKNKKPDAELDIHGLSRDEAWHALEIFFNESKGKNLEKILIIHGKGNHSTGEAVLKRIVMEFIEQCPFAGESGRGKAASGGEGATWVLLK